jgi:hypothetical protein
VFSDDGFDLFVGRKPALARSFQPSINAGKLRRRCAVFARAQFRVDFERAIAIREPTRKNRYPPNFRSTASN